MDRKLWVTLAVIGLSFSVFGLATAAPSGGQSPPPSSADVKGPSVTRSPNLKRIGYTYPIRFVYYVTEPALTTTTSSTWQKLPDAWIRVPVQRSGAIIFARFTAQTGCAGGSGFCGARILFRKLPYGTARQMEPAGVTDMDSTGDDQWESHSIERALPGNVRAGAYLVWVEITTGLFDGSSIAPTFSLENWTFTAQAAW
jgi:hypothetical protein